jgi:hypothetical protein
LKKIDNPSNIIDSIESTVKPNWRNKMAVRPSEVPVMNEERRIALDDAVIKIDAEVLKNAGRDPHHIFIEYLGETSGTYKGWFYDELVKLYTESGWKYVTVYSAYSSGSHCRWSSCLHLSQTAGLVNIESSGKMLIYLKGHPIITEKPKPTRKFWSIFK